MIKEKIWFILFVLLLSLYLLKDGGKKSILEKNLHKIYRKQKLLYVINHKRLRKVIKQLKCFYPFICVIIFSILNLLL